jgi:hypothetical protein
MRIHINGKATTPENSITIKHSETSMSFEQIRELCEKERYENALHDVLMLVAGNGFFGEEAQDYIEEVWNLNNDNIVYGTSVADFVICQIRRELMVKK